MSVSSVSHSTRPLRVGFGFVAALFLAWSASAAEQPFRWHPHPPSDPMPPDAMTNPGVIPHATLIEGDALSESELKWSFIDWVNTVASSKPEEGPSIVSSALDVDRATATQLIGFSDEAMSRLHQSISDLMRGFCDSLRAAKTEQAFVSAFEAQSLQAERLRAEVIGDLDASFAGATAAKIHTWIDTNARPSEKQLKIDFRGMFANPETRRAVLDQACGAAAK